MTVAVSGSSWEMSRIIRLFSPATRFFSGAEDPCAPDEKGFRHAVEKMKQAGFAEVQGYLFPGLRHEILNETCREEVFARIWTDAIEPNI